MSNEKKSAWRSPWVIGWTALVVIVLLVNLLMVYLAAHNNPGLVKEDYYARGRRYEENVGKQMMLAEQWKLRISAPEVIAVALPAEFRCRIEDATGQPLTPEKVTLFAYRPADAKQDFSVTMSAMAPGEYRAQASFPLKGVWDLMIAAQQGDEEHSAALRISAGVRSAL